MHKLAKLALVVIFGIVYLTSCGGNSPTPKPVYSLNGIYALDYEISDVSGPDGYTVDQEEFGWEFSTTDRVLTFVREYYPEDYDSSNIDMTSNIEDNKASMVLSYTYDNGEVATFTIDIELTSDEAFTYNEVAKVVNSANPNLNRGFTRSGKGQLQEEYKLANGTYDYVLTVATSEFTNVDTGDTASESITINGNTVSIPASLSDNTLTSELAYNRAIFAETRTNDEGDDLYYCFTFIELTSSTTFDSAYICSAADDGEILLTAYGEYSVSSSDNIQWN